MNTLTKKIIRDYIYHLETLEDFKEISGEAEGLFREELKKKDEEALNALIPDENQKPEQQDSDTVSFEDKDFKKLFRKLAIKCHPDKTSTIESKRELEFLKRAYEQLTLANDTYDWGLLLKVAIDLEVDLIELDEDKISNINQKTQELKESINKYEQSMAYQWYLKSGDERDKYLQDCAAIFKMSLKKNN